MKHRNLVFAGLSLSAIASISLRVLAQGKQQNNLASESNLGLITFNSGSQVK